MTMRFYDALQLDPSILKRKIAACDTNDEKAYYWIAMAMRSILIVAFAIVFISLLSGVLAQRQNHAEIDTIPYPQKCRKSAVSGRFFIFGTVTA